MSRLVAIVCLLSLSVSGVAQQRIVRVRLFWQHPPATIHVVPDRAFVRTCATCAQKPLSSAVDLAAQGSNVVTTGVPSSTLLLSGRARITGEDFSPFPIDGELRVQSRDGLLLLTLSMTLEEYVAAVLQGESSGFKSDEALKAMAVAARTYAVHFGSRHPSKASISATSRIARTCASATSLRGQVRQLRRLKVSCFGSKAVRRQRTTTAVAAAKLKMRAYSNPAACAVSAAASR